MGEGKPEVGTVGWIDITSGRADGLREFYREVVGWGVREVGMGGYSDYSMVAPDSGRDAAGVCHLRGTNAAIPPDVWLPYFVVDSLASAVAAALTRGGSVVVAERSAGGAARFSVVRDPAGAFAALSEAGDSGAA
jgi:hypothetical protein